MLYDCLFALFAGLFSALVMSGFLLALKHSNNKLLYFFYNSIFFWY